MACVPWVTEVTSIKVNKKRRRKKRKRSAKTYEEYACLLDVFTQEKESNAQAIGSSYFTLLELVLKPRENADSLTGKCVYVGRVEDRAIVKTIIGRLSGEELTENSKRRIRSVLSDIILPYENIEHLPDNLGEAHTQSQKIFTSFFNTAGLLMLRLLPGLTNQKIRKIVEEREKEKFSHFWDIIYRTGFYDLGNILVERIVIELGLGGGTIINKEKIPKTYELKTSRPSTAKPYDPSGFDPKKYSSWRGRDPETVRCKNCLHWRGTDWYCLARTRNNHVHPTKYWCRKFRNRKATPKLLQFIKRVSSRQLSS